MPSTDTIGTVYLVHFSRPFGHAKHYLGFAINLPGRLFHHRRGTGARLLAHVGRAGIAWEVVRTWENVTRGFERRLKNGGSGTRYCPVCCSKPRSPRPDGTRNVCLPPRTRPTATRSLALQECAPTLGQQPSTASSACKPPSAPARSRRSALNASTIAAPSGAAHRRRVTPC